MTKESLGDRLLRLRTSAKLTQTQVAERVGCSRVAVTKWESGDTENIKLGNLMRISRLYGLTADELISGTHTYPTQSAKATALAASEAPAPTITLAWPFKLVSMSRVTALSEHDRGFVEGKLLAAIEECELARPSKRQGNGEP